MDANPEFFTFLLQVFQTIPEIGFRTSLLALAVFMPENWQQEFSRTELGFLLDAGPKESHRRTGEIKAWIQLTKPLPNAKLSFLMLYDQTRDMAVRYFLLEALRNLPKN